jgi:MFS family permease
MFAPLRAAWALFLGIGLMMLGGGLQSALLGVRAELEAFPTLATGAIMSAYFVGFLAGSLVVPRLIASVGHVRVFAALASLASTAALVHVIFVEPATWAGMRLVTGFAYAGLFIVAESWLNDRATNATRGGLLAAYMVVLLGGSAGGQLLLNLESPAAFQLFAMVSVLISLSLIPLLLSAAPAPAFGRPEPVALRQLYRASPLGVVGCFGVGMAHGAALGMGAVYAGRAGLDVAEISAFMGAVYLGGILLQGPIGWLSDRFDRRLVLTVTTLAAAAAALGAVLAAGVSTTALIACAALFGGLTLPLYALAISHTNDFLAPQQMTAASAKLYLVTGVGATLGPIAVAQTMGLAGPGGFFLFLAAVHLAIGVFALWRMTRRASVPLAEQGHYATFAASGGQIAVAMAAEDSAEHQRHAAHDDSPDPATDSARDGFMAEDLAADGLPAPANDDDDGGSGQRVA